MKNKKFILLTMILIGVIALFASIFISGQNSYIGKTTRVKRGNIRNYIKENGTVFSKRVNIFYSDISQRVEVLNVSIGDKVEKGDLILTYENNFNLEIQRANKQIEAITASYNETVKGADFGEISNMKLKISTLETNLNLAKSNLEKTKTLFTNDAVSKAELDEAQNKVLTLENQLQEAKNNYNLLIKGVSSYVKKQYEAKIEEIMVQIKILEKNIEKSSIKAEFKGVITELNIHQGGMTKPGIPVAEIQDDNNLGIYIEILSDDAKEVVKGMDFIVKHKNAPEQKLAVSRIYPKAEAKISDLGVEQRRVRVEADLSKENNYKIGSEVEVLIVLNEKNNVLILDKDAVYEKQGKKYVTIIQNNKQTEREVQTGLEDDENVEIISGLNENENILVDY